jgi:hypothetical protein
MGCVFAMVGKRDWERDVQRDGGDNRKAWTARPGWEKFFALMGYQRGDNP